jgi:hypothetical protein
MEKDTSESQVQSAVNAAKGAITIADPKESD